MDEKILHNLILDYIESPVWLINEHYELLAYNESFVKIFGENLLDNQVHGGNFIEMFDKHNEIEIWKSAVFMTLENGKHKFTYPVKIDDKQAFFEIKTLLVKPDEESKLISVIANDITERKD